MAVGVISLANVCDSMTIDNYNINLPWIDSGYCSAIAIAFINQIMMHLVHQISVSGQRQPNQHNHHCYVMKNFNISEQDCHCAVRNRLCVEPQTKPKIRIFVVITWLLCFFPASIDSSSVSTDSSPVSTDSSPLAFLLLTPPPPYNPNAR